MQPWACVSLSLLFSLTAQPPWLPAAKLKQCGEKAFCAVEQHQLVLSCPAQMDLMDLSNTSLGLLYLCSRCPSCSLFGVGPLQLQQAVACVAQRAPRHPPALGLPKLLCIPAL